MKHQCVVCGKIARWGKRWRWFGSYKDLDDSRRVLKFCSQRCKELVKEPEKTLTLFQQAAW